MNRNIVLFGCSIVLLIVTGTGCTGFRGGAFLSLNPVGLVCGSTITIKDGDMYRYLSDDKVGTEDNFTTWVVKPISTTARKVKLGVRPSSPYGMYVLRVEFRRSPEDKWRKARYHKSGQNPYALSISRKAIGSVQVEIRIIYRNTVAIPLERGGSVVVDSEPASKRVITPDDIIHRFLVPITFVNNICDL